MEQACVLNVFVPVLHVGLFSGQTSSSSLSVVIARLVQLILSIWHQKTLWKAFTSAQIITQTELPSCGGRPTLHLYRQMWSFGNKIGFNFSFFLSFFHLCQSYFKDPWNTFDFITVVGSIVDALMVEFAVSLDQLFSLPYILFDCIFYSVLRKISSTLDFYGCFEPHVSSNCFVRATPFAFFCGHLLSLSK